MDKSKVKLGIVGNGFMVRKHYLPYLVKRLLEHNDFEITWVKGCLCTPDERKNCPFNAKAYIDPLKDLEQHWKSILIKSKIENCPYEPGIPNSWKSFFMNNYVDGVLVSLPNALHFDPVNAALESNINVIVDKPPTLTARECKYLVNLAENKKLVFVTSAQRRYEDVYATISEEVIEKGLLGEPRVINYLFSYGHFEKQYDYWQHKKSLGGGGSLIANGFHGIDIILWLIKQGGFNIKPQTVSAGIIFDKYSPYPTPERVETVANVRIILDNGGIFNIMTSYIAPEGSLDEDIKIFGTKGAIRLMRDKTVLTDMAAGNLTFQDTNCTVKEWDTNSWYGKRWAPLMDFLDSIINKKNNIPWKIKSPAEDSINTISVLEAAYLSAKNSGKEIFLINN